MQRKSFKKKKKTRRILCVEPSIFFDLKFREIYSYCNEMKTLFLLIINFLKLGKGQRTYSHLKITFYLSFHLLPFKNSNTYIPIKIHY